MQGSRSATVERKTRETHVRVELDLDGSGNYEIATGVPFFDHMLSHVAVHSLIDMGVSCQGDLEVDAHHSVEDVGIAMGQALADAVGDKRGIARYGSQTLPMDEALASVSLDLSGRGLMVYRADIPCDRVGNFDTELVPEFLRAFAHNAGMTLHVTVVYGANTHHMIEAMFKALGRALGQAVAYDARRAGIASTKGVL
ncbi:MAG: imidazoleglycerol-phosphate dehydratase HisB [Anaerolineae bacterium]